MGRWIDGPCSKRCKPGYLTRTYEVVKYAQHGGRKCAFRLGETETQSCLDLDKCVRAKPQSNRIFVNSEETQRLVRHISISNKEIFKV